MVKQDYEVIMQRLKYPVIFWDRRTITSYIYSERDLRLLYHESHRSFQRIWIVDSKFNLFEIPPSHSSAHSATPTSTITLPDPRKIKMIELKEMLFTAMLGGVGYYKRFCVEGGEEQAMLHVRALLRKARSFVALMDQINYFKDIAYPNFEHHDAPTPSGTAVTILILTAIFTALFSLSQGGFSGITIFKALITAALTLFTYRSIERFS